MARRKRETGYFTEDQVRKQLADEVEEAGGIRAFAREHGFSAAYISDILLKRRGLSPAILKLLGLEKWVNVSYRRIYE